MTPDRLRRSAGVLRRAIREPDRRRRIRRDLGRAWRRTSVSPVEVVNLPEPGPPPAPLRDVRALVLAEPPLTASLAYEWQQSTAAPDAWSSSLLDHVEVVVLTTAALLDGPWSAAGAASVIAAAVERGIPALLWDTADVDAIDALAPGLGGVAAVRTVDAGRIPAWEKALPAIPVDVLLPGAQPRWFNPVDRERERTVGLVDSSAPVEESLQPLLKVAKSLGLARFEAGTAPAVLRAAYRTASAWFLPLASDEPLSPRALALAASQTPFVTGPQAAVASVFGDLVPGSADREGPVAAASRSLRAYVRQPELRDRTGLRLHRVVLSSHTTGHRVDVLLSDAGLAFSRPLRRVSAVVPTNRPGQLDHVLEFVGRQDYPSLQLVLVLHGFAADAALAARAAAAGVDDLVVVQAGADLTLGACMNLGVDASDGDVIAKMDDDNLYGTAYLTDLVHAFDYTDAGVVGKLAHYVHLTSSDAVLLRGAEHEHRYVRLVQGGSMVMAGDVVREARFEDVPRAVDTTFLDKVGARGVRVYSADRFNYVSVRRADATSHTWQVSDLEILSTADARLCFYGDPRTHIDV